MQCIAPKSASKSFARRSEIIFPVVLCAGYPPGFIPRSSPLNHIVTCSPEAMGLALYPMFRDTFERKKSGLDTSRMKHYKQGKES
jgi:hypothetical protein